LGLFRGNHKFTGHPFSPGGAPIAEMLLPAAETSALSTPIPFRTPIMRSTA
jgi:hypothetical protein